MAKARKAYWILLTVRGYVSQVRPHKGEITTVFALTQQEAKKYGRAVTLNRDMIRLKEAGYRSLTPIIINEPA